MTGLSYLTTGTEGVTIEVSPEIDLIFGVGFSSNKNVTGIPLESGRALNDNAVDVPSMIRISGIVSNLVIVEGRDTDQPRKTWTLLQELKRRNVLFTLITELDVYENLIITALSNNENVQTGNSLQFNMSLQQMEFVTPTFTEISVDTVDSTGEAADRTQQVNKGVLNADA